VEQCNLRIHGLDNPEDGDHDVNGAVALIPKITHRQPFDSGILSSFSERQQGEVDRKL